MTEKNEQAKSSQKQMPILIRHAMSLLLAFVIALVMSFFVGQYIYKQVQLGKLTSEDQTTFEEGLAYIVSEAGGSESITNEALNDVYDLPDAQRAADLLLAIAKSHSLREDVEEPTVPDGVTAAIEPVMIRLEPKQAIGLYDGLVKIKGIDAIVAAESLLKHMDPEDDAELLQVVDLLETRLLWSRRWASLDLWVRWLGVLADSNAKLTQFTTAKRLGEIPEAADDPRVVAGLAKLSESEHEEIRNAVLHQIAGYAAIAKDPTDYEQLIFNLGKDENKHITRRAWMIVGHLNPMSGFAVDWKNADTFVAEAMLWAAVKTNPENDKPALAALKTEGFEAAGALAMNEWRRTMIPGSDADLVFQQLIDDASATEMTAAWRSILASKDYMNAETTVIEDYGYKPIGDEALAPLYFAGSWIRAGIVQDFDPDEPFADIVLAASLEGVFEHQHLGGNPADARKMLVADDNWPVFARLLAAAYGVDEIDLDRLIGELPLDQPVLLDLFTLALTHADNDTIDRFIRSSHPEMVAMAAMASAIKGYTPRLISGVDAAFLRENPDLDIDALRRKSDSELETLGLRRIDALPALLYAAEKAPPSTNRAGEAKLLKLAMWMRGDLGDQFTPTAEAMLFDEKMPTSTVLMALLHKQLPAALDYLFGDLATPRPDVSDLLIQRRYWHVFRRFVGMSDLKLWLWGDPDAQGFQLEAMRQWYAVNRWKIEQGWWPTPTGQ